MENILSRRKNNAFSCKNIINIICIIIAIVVMIVVAFPIVWMIPGAFKFRDEIFTYPLKFLPRTFSFDNFKAVFNLRDINFASTLIMTLLVALSAVVLSIIVNMLAAYAFARLEFPFKNFLFGLIMTSMFVPGITILLTSLKVVHFLNMMDTFFVLVIPGVASAYNIFFFRQFFLNLPSSLEEAAILDGCSHWGIFFKIFMPLSVTPMIIIGTSVFMGYWNSYLWPTLTIIRNTELKQIMQVIRILNGSESKKYGVVIAATIMSLIGPITMFSIFQKYIVQGIAISGIK